MQKFLQAGGECVSVDSFSNDQLCEIYCKLFTLRWGDTLQCYSRETLRDVFKALRHLVFGVWSYFANERRALRLRSCI
ncbi:hypothetical protein [Serratia ureilytica]|uniref:hypothetical protein n=1 Tax=Serratia ureilytica TaxID=300181 RepID=UPI00386FA62C